MEDFKKYFNNEDYVTKIIGPDEESTAASNEEAKLNALIELLTLPQNKDFKEETLLTLKKENAGDLLITAITGAAAHKHKLVAACWESEINYSHHLAFFVDLSLDDDYLVSLEAITVITVMEPPFDGKIVKESIAKIKVKQQSITSERVVLLNDLIHTLEGFLMKE